MHQPYKVSFLSQKFKPGNPGVAPYNDSLEIITR